MERPQLYTRRPGPSPLGGLVDLRISPALAIPLGIVAGLTLLLLLVGRAPLRELALPGIVVVPAVVAGALLCLRRPAAAIVTVFLLVGAAGSLRALTPITPEPIADLLLAGLWIGVVFGHLGDRPTRRVWLWPALLAPAAYLLLTALQVFDASSVSTGVDAFRAGSWHLMAVLLLALAPWQQATLERAAKGVVAVMILLGAYWLYRFFVGQAEEEISLAMQALPGQTDIRFQGSLPSAPQLALWGASVAPFALARALGEPGRWRLIGLTAFALASFGALAAEVRTGAIALTVGTTLTLLLFLAARAFPSGRRLATGLVLSLLVGAIGVGTYAIAIGGSPESEERFSGIFDPFAETSFNNRLDRWEIAFAEVADEPLGLGLGTTGSAFPVESVNPDIPVNLDSSYVKVAVEQGIPMFVLFLIAMASLLVGLALSGTRVADPGRATIGLGAAGTLAALLVMMFSGYYADRPQALGAWLLVGLGAAQFTSTTRRSPPVDAGGP